MPKIHYIRDYVKQLFRVSKNLSDQVVKTDARFCVDAQLDTADQKIYDIGFCAGYQEGLLALVGYIDHSAFKEELDDADIARNLKAITREAERQRQENMAMCLKVETAGRQRKRKDAEFKPGNTENGKRKNIMKLELVK